MQCELSKVAAPVEWRKGSELLKPSAKYGMKLEGLVAELVIRSLDLGDAGDYSCLLGDWKTSAHLTVKGILFKEYFLFSVVKYWIRRAIPIHLFHSFVLSL